MLRAAADLRAFVILEGPTDCQALDPHVCENTATTFAAHGKTNAEQALDLLDERGIAHVLAIVDRDWVDMLDAPLDSRNVIYTGDYDLGAELFFSGTVIDRLVTAFSDRIKRETHLVSQSCSPKDLVIKLAGPIGVLRFISAREGYGIRCESFPVHEVVISTCGDVDLERLCTLAVSRSCQLAVSSKDVEATLNVELARLDDLMPYCCDHEVASGLATLIRHWGGSAGKAMIEKSSRAAFGCSDLATTSFFKAVNDWSAAVGARIWSCPCGYE